MIACAQYAVDGTAIKLVATSEVPKRVYIHTLTTGELYISGANTVTSANGFMIDKAAGVFGTQIDADDEIWGVCAAGTHTISVMTVFL